MSRLRSPSKHFSRMVISCNPSPSHEIKDMISWYLDDEGFPDPEKDGVVRYFVQEAGEYIWGNTREELGTRLEIPKERWEGKILSFSFVSGTIYDNPIMMEINPSYLAFLEGLNDIDRAQLLHGCWAEMAFGAKYFKREWLQEVDKIPSKAFAVRAYDFGASERTTTQKNPDPTTCIKMYKTYDGYYVLAGEYHEDFYDEVDDIQGAIYKRSGDRDNTMIKQAEYDGEEVYIVAPQDPAAAGKSLWNQQAKFFNEQGFIFKKDPCPINKNKLTKFLPFATAAENGLIKIAKDTFSEKTYNYIMKQLEGFDGERSTTTKKDDFGDTVASAFNYLSASKIHKAVALPQLSSGNTQYSKMKSSMGKQSSKRLF